MSLFSRLRARLGFFLHDSSNRERHCADGAVFRLAALVESSDDAIIGKTLDGIVTNWNRAAENLFGYTAAEIVGRPIAILFPPDRIAEENRILAKVRRGERVEHYETVRRRKDGREIAVSLTISPIHDGSGRIIGVSKIVRDITGRKAAEAAVQVARQRAIDILESISDAFYAVDREWRFTYINRKAEEWWQRRREDLIGKLFWEEFPQAVGSEVYRAHLRAAQERRVIHIETISPILHHWVEASLYPSEAGLSVYFRDIGERKRAEAANARLAAIVQFANDAIVGFSLDGLIESWNPAAERLFGYAAEEAIGQPVRMLVPADRSDELPGFCAALRAGEAVTAETVRVHKDGTRFDVALSLAPIKNGDGTIIGASAAVQDITERKRAEAEVHRVTEALESHVVERTQALAEEMNARQQAEAALHQAQKMEAIGQLTGGVAHDFNNLLTVISGNLDFIERGVEGNARLQRMAASAQRAAERGARLTAQLLAFSRRQTLHPEVLRIDEVIRDFCPLVKRAIGEAIELNLRGGPALWPCAIDPAQLESAVLNLAINARDAMPTGGRLVIACRNVEITEPMATDSRHLQPGRYVEIVVADTGEGMGPEVRQRAFEPFFTTKEIGKGTGLGLSMVYGFVRQSGGVATVESEAGVGTTVTLLFPASDQDVAPRSDRRPAAFASNGGARRAATVLVAEDDEAVLEIVEQTLSGLGYRVLVAKDGPQAVSLLEREGDGIDLLLSDVVMPNGMSGVELAHEARRRKREVRVLLTSGYAGDDLSKHGGTGEFEMLPKPFRPAELTERVQEMLD